METLPDVALQEIASYLCWPDKLPTAESYRAELERERYHPDDFNDHWHQQDLLNFAATNKYFRNKLLSMFWECVTVVVMQDPSPRQSELAEFMWEKRSKMEMVIPAPFTLNCLWSESKPAEYYDLLNFQLGGRDSAPTPKQSKRSSLKSFFSSSKNKSSPPPLGSTGPTRKPKSPADLPLPSALSHIKVLRVYIFSDTHNRLTLGPPQDGIDKVKQMWSYITPEWMPSLQAIEFEMVMNPQLTEYTTKLQQQLETFPPDTHIQMVMDRQMASMFM